MFNWISVNLLRRLCLLRFWQYGQLHTAQTAGSQSPFRECRLCSESQLSSLHDRGCDGFAWNFKNGLNLKVTYFIVFIAKLMPYQKTYFSTASRILTTVNRFTEVSHLLQTVLSASPKAEKVSPDLWLITNILHNTGLSVWIEMLHNN